MAVLPSRKHLVLCWAILMSMTILSLWMGDPRLSGRLSLLAIAILLATAGIKAFQILWVFLNLQKSNSTWKWTFTAFLMTIIFVVWSCAGIGAFFGR